jgi:hypothetical protein
MLYESSLLEAFVVMGKSLPLSFVFSLSTGDDMPLYEPWYCGPVGFERVYKKVCFKGLNLNIT